MIMSLLTWILDKEDIIEEGHETFADCCGLRIITDEFVSDFSLRTVLRKKLSVLEIVCLHLFCKISEDAPEHPVVCQRSRPVAVAHIEADSGEFLCRIRHCRIEITDQTMNSIHRNFPYTEEAKNMVDTEGIEILRHLRQTGLPPCEAVLCHSLPVVCREAPVLTEGRECIRRCTCLRIHMEKLRIEPCVHAGTADADRKVSLEDHALFMSVAAYLRELKIKMILDETPEIYILLVLVTERFHLLCVILGIALPF